MNCPVCDSTRMREVEKDGILIDVCPSCKGVWLDRGELEKLMSDVKEVRQDYNDWYYGESSDQERRAPEMYQQQQPKPQAYQQQPYQQQTNQQPHQQQYQQPYYGSHPQGHPKYRKKKKSVLDVFGDLFD